jgi:hypothetical protein
MGTASRGNIFCSICRSDRAVFEVEDAADEHAAVVNIRSSAVINCLPNDVSLMVMHSYNKLDLLAAAPLLANDKCSSSSLTRTMIIIGIAKRRRPGSV